MPSPDERTATTVVIELEPGWIYVKFAEPKPEPERSELLLRLTIEHWFSAQSGLVIDKTQAVMDGGTLQGINVWYHATDRQPEPAIPESPQPFSLTVEVNNQVFQQVPMEHIEAVVDEAIQIWRSSQYGHGTLVVINPRRIAVVLDEQANRGAVVPVEMIYPAIDNSARTRIQTWLEAPPSRRHVIQIDGSWFSPSKSYDRARRVAEPTFMRTNMTYDPGRRPGNRPDVE